MADDHDLIASIDGTSKTTGTECFTADLKSTESVGIFRIQVSGSLAHVLEVTFDSGSNWTKLNSGVNLVADQLYIFDVIVHKPDTFNMRQATGTVVFDILRVYQVN